MGLRKKIKKFIYNSNINRKYGKFATDKAIKKNWNKMFLNKISFINLAVANVLRKKGHCFYLEIGCDDNVTFNSISLPKKYKYGVDPRDGGNIRKTSDLFFKNNKKKFDVILLDGLHEYKQTQRDLLNSLKFLNNDGYIFIDDLIPLDWKMELVPRIQGRWNGDVWKIGYELSKSKNLKFKIIDIISGVGYLRKVKKKLKYKKMNNILKNQRFKDFLKIYKKLPIISGEKALKLIGYE